MMENDRFVVLIDDNRIVVIDKAKVRKILDEHIAPFPKIFNVSQHSPLWKKRRHGKSVRGLYLGGFVDADRKRVDESMIWIKHDAVDSVDTLRSYIIHELRHWWQHANPERLARFYLRKDAFLRRAKKAFELVFAACVVGGLIGLALVGLGGMFVSALFLSLSLTCLWSALFAGETEKVVERDAYGYVDEHGDDPEWKEAVFIFHCDDELDQLRQEAEKVGEAFGLQKPKSDL